MKGATLLNCLVGLLLLAAVAVGAGTPGGAVDAKIRITSSLCSWAGAKSGSMSQDALKAQPAPVNAILETGSVAGFAVALFINGLGVAGTGFYLRRRYNIAGRRVVRLPLFMDVALSVALLLVVSPVLMAVAAAGALKTGAPKVYGSVRTLAASGSNEVTGLEAV